MDFQLCSTYTWSAGWESPVQLYLGEGASDYLALIEQAAAVWNTVLGSEAIELVRDQQPDQFSVSSAIWSETETESDTNINDSQSVIYFKASSAEQNSSGFTTVRWDVLEMVEADVYINIRDEAKYGINLALTELVLEVDDLHGAYSFVNRAFDTILHELGHVLGLNRHIFWALYTIATISSGRTGPGYLHELRRCFG